MSENSVPTAAPWFSFRGKDYDGKFPPFYRNEDYAWASETEKLFSDVLNASSDFLENFDRNSDPYFNQSMVTKKDAWRQRTFYFWGRKNNSACTAAPAIDRFVRSIPGMLSAGISMLQPASAIKPHFGDTDAVMRCHIGIKVPAGLPACGLKVNGESHAWAEGKWLLFCDAHKHEAWNNTNETRIVLIVDVLLPQFLPMKRSICSDVRSMLTLQSLEEKIPVVKKFPGRMRGMIRRFFRLFHYLRFSDAY